MNKMNNNHQMEKKTKMNYISLTSFLSVIALLLVYAIFIFFFHSINKNKIIPLFIFLLITTPICGFLSYITFNFFRKYGKMILTKQNIQIKYLFKQDIFLNWNSIENISFFLSKGIIFPWIKIGIISNEASISIDQFSFRKSDFNDIFWFILHMSEFHGIKIQNKLPARLDDIYQRYQKENFYDYLKN